MRISAMKRWRSFLPVACVLAACGGETAEPRPQWVVRLHTDARVPQFGDRLLVQALDDESDVACPDCRRLLAVTSEGWPVSFGIVANERATPRLRVRLLRRSTLNGTGEPEGELLIDRVVSLPATQEKLEVDVVLSMSCFGVPADLAARKSCDPTTGELAADVVARANADVPRVASWPSGIDRDCSGSEPEGMACVPGGAFLIGALDGISVEPMLGTTPERLVRLDPFWLDREELSVGEARALLLGNPGLDLPVSFDPEKPLSEHCTFLSVNDAQNDSLPLNCIPRFLAEDLCEAKGSRLPTEAEWEFAAGNRTDESRYPWGEDADVCEHAIVSRAFLGYRDCLSDSIDPGIVALGSGKDITSLGIQNLGGSVSEWVADQVAAFDAPCWLPESRLVENPLCNAAQAGPYTIAFRGGFWSGATFLARATTRLGAQMDGIANGVGVRCARSAL
jgi:sulfatase modifying factor 1